MPKLKKPGKTKMKETISFEEKLKQLKMIVEDLENGEIPLKESMGKYQEGLDFIKQCHEELENAELKIEKIMKKEGKITTESMND
ncbi:exodeoxyribonuclease VII small subunit [archaeon]|jgi:exodeoxyribonuclease VII small subunit|nr:exodeoxyribonuclease VII small subunit [archaeon]MBT4241488.1 exodeoxyribonuclease VII small subunit [archaeon]MBT4417641.1 exodeoxyribonuclease VII small subunit [archaeon]